MQTATALSPTFPTDKFPTDKFPTTRLLHDANHELKPGFSIPSPPIRPAVPATTGQPRLLPRILPMMPTEPAAYGTTQQPLAQSFANFTVADHTGRFVPQRQDAPSCDPVQSLLSLLQGTQGFPQNHHKRSCSSEDDEEDGEGSPFRGPWAPERKRKKTKSRKPTYLVRKEEKDLLLEQVEKLTAQVSFLRQRSGITEWQGKDQQLLQKEITNNMLREAVRNQQLAFLSAQSAISELMTVPERCPLDSYIHLGKDWTKRRETLVAMKAQKIHDARKLLEKRVQFMDPTKEFTEDTCFSTEAGDYCQVSFQTIPLPGATSVRQVYDTLHFLTQNMERTMSAAIGTVVTSDGDDNWDKTILHRRMVHSNVHDVLTESNFVVFTDFINDPNQWTKSNGNGCGSSSGRCVSSKELGVIVLDYVDEDELYPYRSRQCVRQDVTSVMTLRSVPCKPKPGSDGQQQEHVVVITKWIMLKLRHNSEIELSNLKMQELKDRVAEIGNALIRAMKASPMAPLNSTDSTSSSHSFAASEHEQLDHSRE
uniref:START domain-containing protein n=1 Tax=Globisporangium ultimum (strain ATCC 200006 / CBS 805.95 / DAOM BR144) TaxID=431595 RepID=K3X3D2_GLOUD